MSCHHWGQSLSQVLRIGLGAGFCRREEKPYEPLRAGKGHFSGGRSTANTCVSAPVPSAGEMRPPLLRGACGIPGKADLSINSGDMVFRVLGSVDTGWAPRAQESESLSAGEVTQKQRLKGYIAKPGWL